MGNNRLLKVTLLTIEQHYLEKRKIAKRHPNDVALENLGASSTTKIDPRLVETDDNKSIDTDVEAMEVTMEDGEKDVPPIRDIKGHIQVMLEASTSGRAHEAVTRDHIRLRDGFKSLGSQPLEYCISLSEINTLVSDKILNLYLFKCFF